MRVHGFGLRVNGMGCNFLDIYGSGNKGCGAFYR